MPTTLVSFIGTGRKRDRNDPRSQYEKITYEFSFDGAKPFRQEASFFGIALLHALRQRGEHVARWVVLGTNASLWPELIGLVEEQDALLDQYVTLDDKVLSRTVCEEDLDAWQRTVNGAQSLVEVRCCLVDEALTKDGQTRIARHLLEQVPRESDVVFDVSHGFRHQPIIATHVVSMMRWTHGIRSVRFFSGVLEASRNGVAPAVELPICQQLAQVTEAAATLELTGNYEPLARQIGADAGAAWFLENTNQLHNAKQATKRLRDSMSKSAKSNPEPVTLAAVEILARRLSWIDADRFADRVHEAACEAIEHDDYLRAIVLAYESIVVLAVERLLEKGDPLNFEHREEAAKRLRKQLTKSEVKLFNHLKAVRNACAHGSRSDLFEAQTVLAEVRRFRQLLGRATQLFDTLATRLAKRRQPATPSGSRDKPPS
jgi:CRISPR-associated Csx2 family protein